MLRELDTESAWTKVVALSPDEKTLYAANWSGDDVSEIDLATGKLRRRIPVADTPRGLWPTADGKRCGSRASASRRAASAIDLATGKVDARLRSSGGAMRHIVADEKRGRAVHLGHGQGLRVGHGHEDGQDEALREDRPQAEHDRPLARRPRAVRLLPGREQPEVATTSRAPSGARSCCSTPRTGKPLDAIVGGNQCTALDVSADGGLLVFSDFLDDRLRVYEVPAYETLAKGGGGRCEAHFADITQAGAAPRAAVMPR